MLVIIASTLLFISPQRQYFLHPFTCLWRVAGWEGGGRPFPAAQHPLASARATALCWFGRRTSTTITTIPTTVHSCPCTPSPVQCHHGVITVQLESYAKGGSQGKFVDQDQGGHPSSGCNSRSSPLGWDWHMGIPSCPQPSAPPCLLTPPRHSLHLPTPSHNIHLLSPATIQFPSPDTPSHPTPAPTSLPAFFLHLHETKPWLFAPHHHHPDPQTMPSFFVPTLIRTQFVLPTSQPIPVPTILAGGSGSTSAHSISINTRKWLFPFPKAGTNQRTNNPTIHFTGLFCLQHCSPQLILLIHHHFYGNLSTVFHKQSLKKCGFSSLPCCLSEAG